MILSDNWAGYIYCVAGISGTQCPNSNANSGVTEVIAEWTVPNIASTSSSNEYSSTWIGIGGDNPSGDLVQMGTQEDVTPSGSRTFSTWWEMLPASETLFTLSGGVSPGDTIYAKLSYGGTDILGLQVWNFLMEDVTSGQYSSFGETCWLNCYASTFSSADFIEEAVCLHNCGNPSESDISQLPAFTQTKFLNDQIFVGGSANGFLLSQNLSGNLFNVIIKNPYYVDVAVGLASTLGTGEFWANYLVSVGNCLFSQTCYSLSTNSIDYGQTMSATLQLYSVSSFSTSTATNLGFGMSIRSSGGTVYGDASHDVYGLSISSGTGIYTRQFSIVSGETAGSYQVSLAIWYVPSGGSIGGAGSLQIATNGFSSSILTVYNQLSVGPPSVSPSTIQMGQNTILTASASGGSGGYSYSWNGLPSGCQSVNQASFSCTPTSMGQFSISVKVTDSTGVSVVSSSSPLTVTAVTTTVVSTQTVTSTSYSYRTTTTTSTSYTSTTTSTSTIPTVTTVVLVPLTITSTVQSTQYLTSTATTTVTNYTDTQILTSTIPTVTTVALVQSTVTSIVQSIQYLTSILSTTVTNYTDTQTSTSTVVVPTTIVLVPLTATSTEQSTRSLTSTATTTMTSYTSTMTLTSTVPTVTTVVLLPTTTTSTVQETQWLTSTVTTTTTNYTDTVTSTSTSVVYTTVTVSQGAAGSAGSTSLTYLSFLSLLAMTVGQKVVVSRPKKTLRVRSTILPPTS